MKETTRIVTARLTFIMKDEPSELTAIEGELMRLTGADDVEIIKVQDFINDEAKDCEWSDNPYQE